MKSITSKKELKRFGIFFSVSFFFLVGSIVQIFGIYSFKLWTFYISIFLLGLAIFRPLALVYVYKFWIFFRDLLIKLISKMILFLFFFIVLTPLALIMKIFKYDPLKKSKSLSKSYRERKKNKINLKKIY